MCGINGFIQFKTNNDNRKYSNDFMWNLVHGMNDKIVHRGPNDEGMYVDDNCAIGMRRLAIIDINNGNQPIFNEKKDKVIIFNGEIYNYKELKSQLVKEGCKFYTNSDTEVILQGIEQHGRSFINNLDGMFSFCIYDIKKQTWLISRDRMGEKPLYLYKTSDYLMFGSELKSLISSGILDKEISEEALSIYFQLAYIPAPFCIIKGVRKMMPATSILINSDGSSDEQMYWDVKDYTNNDKSYDAYTKELKDLLYKSVERRMISDKPIGIFLSGGVDSTVVAGIMSDISNEPIKTFTVGFKEKEFDESQLAKIVSKRFGAEHHPLLLEWDEAVKNLDDLLENIDEPFADPSLVATYAISKLTRNYVSVALTGDGGDELFAGYDKYLITYYTNLYGKLPGIIRKGIIEPSVRLLPTDSTVARKANKVIMTTGEGVLNQRIRMLCRGFRDDESKKLIPGIEMNNLKFIKDQYGYKKTFDEQKKTQYVDLKTVLEGCMLPKGDRASMKASLETRLPLLDHRIVELTFEMPTEYKIKGREKKIIFKDTFKDLIPNEIKKAKKHGFGVPVGEWLRAELKPQLLAYCDRGYIMRQEIFEETFISAVADEHFNYRRNRWEELWCYYVFQKWYENYIA